MPLKEVSRPAVETILAGQLPLPRLVTPPQAEIAVWSKVDCWTDLEIRQKMTMNAECNGTDPIFILKLISKFCCCYQVCGRLNKD